MYWPVFYRNIVEQEKCGLHCSLCLPLLDELKALKDAGEELWDLEVLRLQRPGEDGVDRVQLQAGADVR
eukprot:scaffold288535_cov37-Prasinocladus_malaysianus.AAC.1